MRQLGSVSVPQESVYVGAEAGRVESFSEE